MTGHSEIVCLGGAFVDRKFHLDGASERGTPSACGRTVVSFGGVARNVAENLARLGLRARLISLVGDDGDGRALLDDLVSHGVDAPQVERVRGASTAAARALVAATLARLCAGDGLVAAVAAGTQAAARTIETERTVRELDAVQRAR